MILFLVVIVTIAVIVAAAVNLFRIGVVLRGRALDPRSHP